MAEEIIIPAEVINNRHEIVPFPSQHNLSMY